MSSPSSPCPTLAVLGTASDVGKSLITAGICRLLSDSGVSVAPYKAQNMSNNSGVTDEGKEMGRAQIVQAHAARVEPHEDMNPVLLKPSSENGSQVIVLGKAVGTQDAQSYFSGAGELKKVAYEALDRLRARHECVVIEGAGSCAEVNLRAREYVNFPCAHHADARVILVADIDRGGVFAQIIGSLEVMPDEDRARVAGIIVNRFRGDRSLFDDGVSYIEERTGLPVLGVLPYLMGLAVESEDSLQLQAQIDPPLQERPEPTRVRIGVLRLPHISNSTDFDALLGLDGVDVHFLYRPRDLESYDLIILPGSKNVRTDLAWLRETQWDVRLDLARTRDQRIVGICGGYQMLGETISDPDGVESAAGASPGLGYLPMSTRLQTEKALRQVSGTWIAYQAPIAGYEIHMGESTALPSAASCTSSAASLHRSAEDGAPASEQTPDGLISEDGRVWGSYVHGLFDSPEFLRALLEELKPSDSDRWKDLARSVDEHREKEITRFTALLKEHLNTAKLFELTQTSVK